MNPKESAVLAAYQRGETVANICDIFGLTRAELAVIVKSANVSRGMEGQGMTAKDVVILYTLLRDANTEIGQLRQEVVRLTRLVRTTNGPV